jgi:Polymerase beta, Nucleotidyltransferase
MGDVAKNLQIRLAERETVLQRIIKQLASDERVVAAWLYGSLGRNDGDALSDIDVRIIVADAFSEAMNTERQTCASRVGPLLLVQEAPHNAPPGGAFLLVMYPGSVGPIHVDWTWQPQSRAVIPSDAHVLFDRVELPVEAPLTRPSGQGLADNLTERSVFFWMMVQVAAKEIARQQSWAAINVLNYAQDALLQVKWLLDLANSPTWRENRRLDPVPARAPEQMALVHAMANDMEAFTARIAGLGGQVPSGVIPVADRFFDLIDAMIESSQTEAN